MIANSNAFEEADKEKYVEFFNRVSYPVFFIGTSKLSISTFTMKNITLKMAYINQDAYAKKERVTDPNIEEERQKLLKELNAITKK